MAAPSGFQTFGGFVVDERTKPSPPVTLPSHLQRRFQAQGVVCFGVTACQRFTQDGELLNGFALITQRFIWIVEMRDGGAGRAGPTMHVTHAMELQHIAELIGFGEACAVIMLMPTPELARRHPCVVIRFVTDPMNDPQSPHEFIKALMRTAKTQAGAVIDMTIKPPTDPRNLGPLSVEGYKGPDDRATGQLAPRLFDGSDLQLPMAAMMDGGDRHISRAGPPGNRPQSPYERERERDHFPPLERVGSSSNLDRRCGSPSTWGARPLPDHDQRDGSSPPRTHSHHGHPLRSGRYAHAPQGAATRSRSRSPRGGWNAAPGGAGRRPSSPTAPAGARWFDDPQSQPMPENPHYARHHKHSRPGSPPPPGRCEHCGGTSNGAGGVDHTSHDGARPQAQTQTHPPAINVIIHQNDGCGGPTTVTATTTAVPASTPPPALFADYATTPATGAAAAAAAPTDRAAFWREHVESYTREDGRRGNARVGYGDGPFGAPSPAARDSASHSPRHVHATPSTPGPHPTRLIDPSAAVWGGYSSTVPSPGPAQAHSPVAITAAAATPVSLDMYAGGAPYTPHGGLEGGAAPVSVSVTVPASTSTPARRLSPDRTRSCSPLAHPQPPAAYAPPPLRQQYSPPMAPAPQQQHHHMPHMQLPSSPSAQVQVQVHPQPMITPNVHEPSSAGYKQYT